MIDATFGCGWRPRYELARQYVAPGPLLDIACGTGYGSELLQGVCKGVVVGVDIDRPSLMDARRAYSNRRIAFLVGVGTAIPARAAAFSTITSMETLEHIGDDENFLGELVRVLRPGGVCIISTPNRMYSLRHGISNPYHVREYSEDELIRLLSGFFQITQVFYQGFAENYYANVRSYSESIQARKRHLNPLLRWPIDHLYKPLKRLIPAPVANYFVRRMLGLSYPQPCMDDITISAQPVQDCGNFVFVCRKSTS